MPTVKHILSTDDFTNEEIQHLTSPDESRSTTHYGKRMSLLFCSTSTRTRLSFIQALDELEMLSVVLNPEELRMSDDESIADTATAVSCYSDLIGIRTLGGRGDVDPLLTDAALAEFTEGSSSPVINMASNSAHPCQALADLRTIRESFLPERNKRIVISWAYSPDSLRPASVMNDLVKMLPRAGYSVAVCCPPELGLDSAVIEAGKSSAEASGADFSIHHDPTSALSEDALVLYPRNWTSTEFSPAEAELEKQLHAKYANWNYDEALLARCAPKAHFMHCLPVRREYEASNELIDGRRSWIKRQMLNRVPVQRKLIDLLLS